MKYTGHDYDNGGHQKKKTKRKFIHESRARATSAARANSREEIEERPKTKTLYARVVYVYKCIFFLA